MSKHLKRKIIPAVAAVFLCAIISACGGQSHHSVLALQKGGVYYSKPIELGIISYGPNETSPKEAISIPQGGLGYQFEPGPQGLPQMDISLHSSASALVTLEENIGPRSHWTYATTRNENVDRGRPRPIVFFVSPRQQGTMGLPTNPKAGIARLVLKPLSKSQVNGLISSRNAGDQAHLMLTILGANSPR